MDNKSNITDIYYKQSLKRRIITKIIKKELVNR